MMAVFSILFVACLCIVPLSLFSQQVSLQSFSSNAHHSRNNVGLKVRKASFRRIQPDRFSAPLFSAPLQFLPLFGVHRSPREELFINEMVISDGAIADARSLYETRRNLLQTGLFRRVDIVLSDDGIEEDDYTDARLFLFERQPLETFLLVESGGEAIDLGLGFNAINVDQTGAHLKIGIHYRQENTIGLQGDIAAEWNIRETREQQPLWIKASAWANRYNAGIETGIIAPFSDMQPYNEWSMRLSYYAGQEFFYLPTDNLSSRFAAAFKTTPFSSFRFHSTGIISGSYWGADFYLSGTAQVDISQRDKGTFFIPSNSIDNTALFLAELGTEQRRAVLLDDHCWGIIPNNSSRSIGTMIETGYHIQGGIIGGFRHNTSNSQSWQQQSVFLMSLLGASPVYLSGRFAYSALLGERLYSSLKAEFWGEAPFSLEAKNHIAISNGTVLATRLRGEIANGGVVILDNSNGVRGYGMNTLIGGYNYWLFNAELRGLLIGEIGAYKLTGTVFGDVAFLGDAFRSNKYLTLGASFGAGLRLSYPAFLTALGEQSGEQGILRVDLAVVGSPLQFGQIILSTKEVFTLFDNLPLRQERLIGTRRFVE